MLNYVFICVGAHAVDPTIDMRMIGLTDARPTDSILSSRFSWPDVIDVYSGDNPAVAFRAAALKHSGCQSVTNTPIIKANAWSITYTNLHGPENILAGLSLWEYRPVIVRGWLVDSKNFELRLIARYWAISVDNNPAVLLAAETSALKSELSQAESRACLANIRLGGIERDLVNLNVKYETVQRECEKFQAELAEERKLSAGLMQLHATYKDEIKKATTAENNAKEAAARADLEVSRLSKLAAADYSEIQSLRSEIQALKRSLADRVAEIETARKMSPNRAPPPKNQPRTNARDTLSSAILAFDRSTLKKTALNIV